MSRNRRPDFHLPALLLGVAVSTLPAFGQGATAGAPGAVVGAEAMKVLKQAQDSLSKVKIARYDAAYTASGWLRQFVPAVEGTVIIGEPSKYEITRFRCEVRVTPHESDEKISLAAGSDGDLFFMIDPTTKTVYADMDQAVLGKHSRTLHRVLMSEFVIDEPLKDELEAKEMELGEETVVGGEPCYQVRLSTSDTNRVAWFFSKKDFLPRRVDRFRKNREGEEGTTSLVLTGLSIDLTFRPEPFRLRVPSGYKRTDEFAP